MARRDPMQRRPPRQADVDLEGTEMMKRLASGQWSLRDMREQARTPRPPLRTRVVGPPDDGGLPSSPPAQFQAVMKMGPLSSIMNSFPGMQGLDFRESSGRIKRWMTIMDSMTDTELDDPKVMNTSRIFRIAQGSGYYPAEVIELLDQYKMMQTTMHKTMKKVRGEPPQGGAAPRRSDQRHWYTMCRTSGWASRRTCETWTRRPSRR